MDRLQAAIAQARSAREAILSTQSGTPDATPDQVISQPTDNWQALIRFEPDANHLIENRIVTRDSGAKSAPFDVLRTRALQQMSMQGWKRLAVTSPGPGCGKSTVTMNLAFSLARQPDIRTLVIDLDLRRPMLATLLGLEARHEFTDRPRLRQPCLRDNAHPGSRPCRTSARSAHRRSLVPAGRGIRPRCDPVRFAPYHGQRRRHRLPAEHRLRPDDHRRRTKHAKPGRYLRKGTCCPDQRSGCRAEQMRASRRRAALWL